MRGSVDSDKWKKLTEFKEPNEFIKAYRALLKEELGRDVLPLSLDEAADIAEGFIGRWILLCSELPVTREQLDYEIGRMIDLLREFQETSPSEADKFKTEVRRFIKKGCNNFRQE